MAKLTRKEKELLNAYKKNGVKFHLGPRKKGDEDSQIKGKDVMDTIEKNIHLLANAKHINTTQDIIDLVPKKDEEKWLIKIL